MKEKYIDKLNEILEVNSSWISMKIDEKLTIYYIQTLVKVDYIVPNIKQPYFNKDIDFKAYFFSISKEVNFDEIENAINKGCIIAVCEGIVRAIYDAARKESRGITENIREASIEGGIQGFSEDLRLNENIIRTQYGNSNLIVKETFVGVKAPNACSIIYDKTTINKDALKYIEDKMKDIKAPVIQSISELQQYLLAGSVLIPRMLVTSRPDRVIRNLAKGKVVILMNTTPSALIAPATFHEFLTAVDDYFLFPIPAAVLIVFRYIGLLLSAILPGVYVAITSFNPEFFRIQLAMSITASRTGVSYPSFIEVILMLIMMEFLIEASIRLPKNIGQAATTVGGLILGQAATQAGLVSDIMVIIVAAVAISNFSLPVQVMSSAVRIVKYIFIILSMLGGLYGIYIGVFAYTIYCFSIYSINTAFINPIGAITTKKLKNFFRKV